MGTNRTIRSEVEEGYGAISRGLAPAHRRSLRLYDFDAVELRCTDRVEIGDCSFVAVVAFGERCQRRPRGSERRTSRDDVASAIETRTEADIAARRLTGE